MDFNPEKIVASYLRGRDDVAAIVGRRIVAKTPGASTGGVADPWVRLTVINAPQDPRASFDHLVALSLQLDCFAGEEGGEPEAMALALVVRAAIVEIDQGTHTEAVVTAGRVTNFFRNPDRGLEPARECVVILATVHAHPV